MVVHASHIAIMILLTLNLAFTYKRFVSVKWREWQCDDGENSNNQVLIFTIKYNVSMWCAPKYTYGLMSQQHHFLVDPL